MSLRLSSAGESHGPALVAIVTGLPAGLTLDRAAIDADLARRQAGYGRSPRQSIEQDTVEVLAASGTAGRSGRRSRSSCGTVTTRTGRGGWRRGRPMESRPAKGRSRSRCRVRVMPTSPACRSSDTTTCANALERASARHTAVHVAAGAVAKALLGDDRHLGARVAVDEDGLRARIDEARKERDTVGGIVEVRAVGVPPGLGSYAAKEDRLDARLAAAVMGIQAVKGVEIGDGFALAVVARLGGARRDRHITPAELQSCRRHRGGRLERRRDRRPCRDEAAPDADEAAAFRRPGDR